MHRRALRTLAVWGGLVVELVANLLGAFAGVSLALVADHRLRRRQARARDEERQGQLAAAWEVVLGSVVKNTSGARRIKSILAGGPHAVVFDAPLELSVWDATRGQFVELCPTVDERVLFARFFDRVMRLQRMTEYHRGLATSAAEEGASAEETGAPTLRSRAKDEICAMAGDVNITGLMLVNDYGAAHHKEMLGIEERNV